MLGQGLNTKEFVHKYNKYMPWIENQFFYTKRLLKTIAGNYVTLYDGLPSWGGQITNPWALAEYKADFDIALNGIGKGKWQGIDNHQFRDFRHYGRLQQIIIADIMGMDDYTLEVYGFYSVPRLRGYAYYLMCLRLNGG